MSKIVLAYVLISSDMKLKKVELKSSFLFSGCSEIGTATLWQNRKRCVKLGDRLQKASRVGWDSSRGLAP